MKILVIQNAGDVTPIAVDRATASTYNHPLRVGELAPDETDERIRWKGATEAVVRALKADRWDGWLVLQYDEPVPDPTRRMQLDRDTLVFAKVRTTHEVDVVSARPLTEDETARVKAFATPFPEHGDSVRRVTAQDFIDLAFSMNNPERGPWRLLDSPLVRR